MVDLQDDVPSVVVVLLGYSTTSDENPLDHDAGEGVYEVIGESPGTYIEQADHSVSTARYHLRVLEDRDLIQTKKLRGKRRLYQATAPDDDIVAALNDEAPTAVIEAVRRQEPASVSELAAGLDRAHSTVSYHVTRLEDAGVLTRERTGEAVRVELTPAARAAVSSPALADD
jgi:predicted transcriptional regulator